MKSSSYANHEMNRELLWRNYPTDMRGTPLRHFWSVRGVKPRIDSNGHTIDAASDEYFMDIKNIHQWKNNGVHTTLGGNTARTVSPSNMVVLAIRGELFQKYPNAMVYARKAIWQTKNVGGITKPDTTKPRLADPSAGTTANPNLRTPIFTARVDDMIFVGFALTATEAKGKVYTGSNHAEALSNPGWYFVIEERAGEPVFGADKFTEVQSSTSQIGQTWDKLEWGHLINDSDDNFIVLNKSITLNTGLNNPNEDKYILWNSNAGDTANALFQRPSRIFLHGYDMLKNL